MKPIEKARKYADSLIDNGFVPRIGFAKKNGIRVWILEIPTIGGFLRWPKSGERSFVDFHEDGTVENDIADERFTLLLSLLP